MFKESSPLLLLQAGKKRKTSQGKRRKRRRRRRTILLLPLFPPKIDPGLLSFTEAERERAAPISEGGSPAALRYVSGKGREGGQWGFLHLKLAPQRMKRGRVSLLGGAHSFRHSLRGLTQSLDRHAEEEEGEDDMTPACVFRRWEQCGQLYRMERRKK